MNSRILLSPSLENRIDQIGQVLGELGLRKEHPDVLYFGTQEKLGVEAAKKVREHLSLKPYSALGRVVIMESGHNLTLDAQNALLKTLEEPPESALLLLGAETEKTFLPTVLSRCQIVIIDKESESQRVEESSNYDGEIQKLIDSSVEERFTFIEKLEDRQEFLERLIRYYHQKLRDQPGERSLRTMKVLLEAEEWSKANGNVRAILEYLMLKL